jgi:hypothetical protein
MIRRALLRAALSYVSAGWTISASEIIGEPPKDHPVLGLTPVNPNWKNKLVNTAQQASHRWGPYAPFAPGIVLVCGHGVDVWGVPDGVGARAVDLLPDEIERDLPIAVTPTGAWHFFTSHAAPEELSPIPLHPSIKYFGSGSFIPLPPSTRGEQGLDLWLNPPNGSFTKQPWEPFIVALTEAAVEAQTSRAEAAG